VAKVEPVLPKFLVKNISGGDLLILNSFPIRPGQTIDVYKSAEYQSDRVDVTNMILRGLEMPDGDIYVKWKIKRKIEVLEFQNPNYQGNGITANKIQTTNDYFEGAVLSVVGGKLVWMDSAASAMASDFLLLAPDSGLPNSRVLTGEVGEIDLQDAGPGSSVNIALADTAVSPGSYGSTLQIPNFTVDGKGRITFAANTPLPPIGQNINGIRRVSTDVSISSETDFTLLVDASAGQVVITLPTPTIDGMLFNIKKVDTSDNFVVVSPETGLLDGDSTQLIIDPWQSMSVQSLDGDWFII
jgi:hypothetical protein